MNNTELLQESLRAVRILKEAIRLLQEADRLHGTGLKPMNIQGGVFFFQTREFLDSLEENTNIPDDPADTIWREQ